MNIDKDNKSTLEDTSKSPTIRTGTDDFYKLLLNILERVIN